MPQATGPGKFITAAGATARSCGLAESAGGGTTAGELIKVRINLPNLKGMANS